VYLAWKPCSRRHGPPDVPFPDTHLTACDLHWSEATAAWRAMVMMLHGVGYIARFRNLMPSLRARRAAGMVVYTTVLYQDNSRAGRPLVVNALHARRSFWRHVQSTLRLMICVYGCADPAVLTICIRLIFGSTIRLNTNSAFFHYWVPNKIRIEYSVQP